MPVKFATDAWIKALMAELNKSEAYRAAYEVADPATRQPEFTIAAPLQTWRKVVEKKLNPIHTRLPASSTSPHGTRPKARPASPPPSATCGGRLTNRRRSAISASLPQPLRRPSRTSLPTRSWIRTS